MCGWYGCDVAAYISRSLLVYVRGLSKKFVQYVYKNFILQILGYINVAPFKILPIWHNTLVTPLFPLLEAPLEFRFS